MPETIEVITEDPIPAEENLADLLGFPQFERDEEEPEEELEGEEVHLTDPVAPLAPTDPPAPAPELTPYDLNGKTYSLPADVAHALSASRAAQSQTDRMMSQMDQLRAEISQLRTQSSPGAQTVKEPAPAPTVDFESLMDDAGKLDTTLGTGGELVKLMRKTVESAVEVTRSTLTRDVIAPLQNQLASLQHGLKDSLASSADIRDTRSIDAYIKQAPQLQGKLSAPDILAHTRQLQKEAVDSGQYKREEVYGNLNNDFMWAALNQKLMSLIGAPAVAALTTDPPPNPAARPNPPGSQGRRTLGAVGGNTGRAPALLGGDVNARIRKELTGEGF